MALTDHDTMDGLPEAFGAGERLGVRVIGGCEFSVRAPWGEMHLLGYFLQPGDPAIEDFLIDMRRMRLDRARHMVDHLQAWGVAISLDDVLRVAGDSALGRPHVARTLVQLGKVPDMETAFDEFLGLGRRAYVDKVLPDFAMVADLVHRSGGLVSAAHLRDRANRTTLSRLAAEGLDAVEVRHPRHPPEITRTLTALADSLGLLRTGGTDWHGDGHDPNCRLGDWAVPVDWVLAMEERLAVRPPPVK